MKILRSASYLLIAALFLQGCDEVRSFYGKPTSADIAVMKDSILAARLQNNPAAEPDTVAGNSADTLNVTAADRSAAEDVLKRYNVVAGAFADSTNAARLEKSLMESGRKTVRMRMKNGLFVVCALSTDDAAAAERLAEEMLADGKDAWVYDANTKKHRD